MAAESSIIGRSLRRLRQLSPAGRRQRESEARQSREIQVRLLPPETPQIQGFQIACAWQPSHPVSGDYFDVFPLASGRMALCIADVPGKGMSAALLAGAVQAAVRRLAPQAESPAELCTEVNRALCDSLASANCITLFYATLDAGGLLRYENAGHCLPLLVRAAGGVEFPASFSGVVGIFSHWLYQNQEIRLGPGDCLLLLTDGVLSATGRQREEFGYRRLISVVERFRPQGADVLAREVLAAVARLNGGRFGDDASLIVVRAD